MDSTTATDDLIDVIEGAQFPRTEEVTCYLCGHSRKSLRIDVKFGLHAMVAECPACRIAFQTPRPSAEASIAYMNWRWRSADNYVGDREGQLQRALRQVGYIRQFLDGSIRILDFGAGAGSFVRAALDQGWTATGVERSDSARSRAREFYGVDLLQDVGDGPYDVITMWDVVEHLRDPREILTMLRDRLAPNGLLFIETGNFENWTRVLEKERWGLYLFDHQFYFSPSSLQRVLCDAGYAGFCLLDCNRIRPPLGVRQAFREPVRAARLWFEWARSRAKWPRHGDINLMVAVGRREPDLQLPKSPRTRLP